MRQENETFSSIFFPKKKVKLICLAAKKAIKKQELYTREGRIGDDESNDTLGGEAQGESHQEFPIFPLGLALEATNHFSHENKLGEGGFGPVYKVLCFNLFKQLNQ